MKVSKLFRAYGLYNLHGANRPDIRYTVSKLFRAYGLYNVRKAVPIIIRKILFQSSFELTGYITT